MELQPDFTAPSSCLSHITLLLSILVFSLKIVLCIEFTDVKRCCRVGCSSKSVDVSTAIRTLSVSKKFL